MLIDIHVEPERLAPDRLLADFIASLDGDGAVVSFVGLARPSNAAGAPVIGLFLDSYADLTLVSLEAIAREVGARFAIGAVKVVHRCGDVGPGDPIVFAAVSARHRRAAFEALDYLVDRLKTDAVFWKREDGVEESRWIEPSERDRTDRARWEEQCRE